MTKTFLALLFPLFLMSVTSTHAHGPDGKASEMFEAYEKGKIPTAYKGLKNPLAADAGDVDAGMRLYEKNCVMCHGVNADGKGHMAGMMKPAPGDLRMMMKMFPGTDDYYLWVIKDGGADFGTSMPGFGQTLGDTEIWQLISWMQTGFAGTDGEIQDHMRDGEDHKMEPGHMPGGSHMMQPGQMMGQ